MFETITKANYIDLYINDVFRWNMEDKCSVESNILIQYRNSGHPNASEIKKLHDEPYKYKQQIKSFRQSSRNNYKDYNK